jgi:serine/threonine protein kinase
MTSLDTITQDIPIDKDGIIRPPVKWWEKALAWTQLQLLKGDDNTITVKSTRRNVHPQSIEDIFLANGKYQLYSTVRGTEPNTIYTVGTHAFTATQLLERINELSNKIGVRVEVELGELEKYAARARRENDAIAQVSFAIRDPHNTQQVRKEIASEAKDLLKMLSQTHVFPPQVNARLAAICATEQIGNGLPLFGEYIEDIHVEPTHVVIEFMKGKFNIDMYQDGTSRMLIPDPADVEAFIEAIRGEEESPFISSPTALHQSMQVAKKRITSNRAANSQETASTEPSRVVQPTNDSEYQAAFAKTKEIGGGWEVGKAIGQGQFGGVYHARHEDGRVGVAKIYKDYIDREAAHPAAQLFRAETRVLRMLNHPGIVRIIDDGETPDPYDETVVRPFIIMERARGNKLEQLVRNGPVEPTKAVHIATQLADALAYAQRETRKHRGVITVHRNLDPWNVMIDSEGKTVITDFGLARDYTDGLHTAIGTGVIENPDRRHYWAPEVKSGDAQANSDTYSITVTLKNLLTGSHSPAELNDHELRFIHPAFREFIVANMSDKFTDREPDAAAYLAKLQSLSGKEIIVVQPQSPLAIADSDEKSTMHDEKISAVTTNLQKKSLYERIQDTRSSVRRSAVFRTWFEPPMEFSEPNYERVAQLLVENRNDPMVARILQKGSIVQAVSDTLQLVNKTDSKAEEQCAQLEKIVPGMIAYRDYRKIVTHVDQHTIMEAGTVGAMAGIISMVVQPDLYTALAGFSAGVGLTGIVHYVRALRKRKAIERKASELDSYIHQVLPHIEGSKEQDFLELVEAKQDIPALRPYAERIRDVFEKESRYRSGRIMYNPFL